MKAYLLAVVMVVFFVTSIYPVFHPLANPFTGLSLVALEAQTAAGGMAERFWGSIKSFFGFLGETIATNWGAFFSRSWPPPEESVTAKTETLKPSSALPDVVQTEVDRVLTERLKTLSSGTGLYLPSQALVVVPASTTASATAVIDRIRESFSDQVFIQPDQSGRSGVIVPIFRQQPGQPYLYILAPIRPP